MDEELIASVTEPESNRLPLMVGMVIVTVCGVALFFPALVSGDISSSLILFGSTVSIWLFMKMRIRRVFPKSVTVYRDRIEIKTPRTLRSVPWDVIDSLLRDENDYLIKLISGERISLVSRTTEAEQVISAIAFRVKNNL